MFVKIFAGKNRDEDFAGIFDETQEVVSEVFESDDCDVAQQKEESGVKSRRESTRSDRSTINRLKDLQQQEVLDLIHCLRNITDHMHVSHGLQTQRGGKGNSTGSRTSFTQSNAEVRPITANSIIVPYRRDVPATPSHMQIRMDDLPPVLNFRESSFTGDNHANRISSGRASFHKSDEFGETTSRTISVSERSLSRSHNFETSGFEDNSISSMTPGFYPAVLDRHSQRSNNRLISSSPVPIKTLGQFGFGMFDLHTPIGIAVAHDGNTILVSDQSKSRILIYYLDSEMMLGFIKCEGEIKDLAISTMGHVLVATNKTGVNLANAYTLDGYKIASLGKLLFVQNDLIKNNCFTDIFQGSVSY